MSMTGRQRILAVLNGQPLDQLAWTTLIDSKTTSLMPEAVRQLHPFDFYRSIGCDICTFGNYGLPPEECVPLPATFVCPDLKEQWTSGPDQIALYSRSTPWGTLTARFHHGHPVKHPVESLEDLAVLRRIWEEGDYVPQTGTAGALTKVNTHLGDDGLYVPALEPSPVQRLIEYEMGMEHFYFMLQDAPAEMEATLAAMHKRRCREYELVAQGMDCEAVIAVENTSSTLTSPEIYRRLSMPQIRDYADILHGYGRKLVLHMCGHLKALLGVLADTHADAYNAPTPPPVGTTYVEDVLDARGDDFPILGAIFNPEVFQDPLATEADIARGLERFYTPRVRRAQVLMWLGVDGLPTELFRFEAVQRWMQRHGRVAGKQEAAQVS